MSKRRLFGELVGVGDVEAVIVMLNPVNEGAYEINARPCQICDDPDCREFDNVMTIDGFWLYHIGECRMTDAKQ